MKHVSDSVFCVSGYLQVPSYTNEKETDNTKTRTNNLLDVSFLLFLKDPNSWLSGPSLINAARNSFAKLMDNLSILMETVQGKPCECRASLEQDSLIQRLACGLHRVNAQALEAGLCDRLPSTVSRFTVLLQGRFAVTVKLP